MKHIKLFKNRFDFEKAKLDFQDLKYWNVFIQPEKTLCYSNTFDNNYASYNIYYTTIDDKPINADNLNYVSNTYENGTGVLTFSEPLTSIENNSFANCNNLKAIILPNKVKKIGDYVFYKCTNLENIIIPSSVTSIADNALYTCTNLDVKNLSTTNITNNDYTIIKTYSISNKDINAECDWYTTTYKIETIGYENSEPQNLTFPIKMDINISSDDIIHKGSIKWNGETINYNITQHGIDSSRISYSISSIPLLYIKPNQTGKITASSSCIVYLDEIIPLKEYQIKKDFDCQSIIEILERTSANEDGNISINYKSYYNNIDFFVNFILLDYDTIEFDSLESTIDYKTTKTSTIINQYFKKDGNVLKTNSKRITEYTGFNNTDNNKVFKIQFYGYDGNEYEYIINQTPNSNNDLLISTIVTDTSGYNHSDYINTLLDNNIRFQNSGNIFFFSRIMSNHNITGVSSIGRISNYDDYGFGIYTILSSVNDWVGGYGSASSYKKEYNIYIGDNTKCINTYATEDENNTIYFDKYFTNIVIKIPYSGLNIKLNINKFPYSFTSDYYHTLYNNLLNCESVFISNDKSYRELGLLKLLNTYTEVNNMIGNVNLQGNDDILTDYINFDILENNTDSYKELYCLNKDISFNVIQENLSLRRIYYGCIYNEELCNSIYGKDGDCFSFFAFNNSKIINENTFEITTNNDIRKKYLFAIPKKIFKSISSEIDEDIELYKDSFYWGDQEYVLYRTRKYLQITVTIELL